MVLVSILSLVGMGTGGTPEAVYIAGSTTSDTVYYDSSGTPISYANGTVYDPDNEQGNFYIGILHQTIWKNSTGNYLVYTNSSALEVVNWETLPQAQSSRSFAGIEISFTDSMIGLWAIIAGLMIFAGIIGIRILYSGTSETSINFILVATIYGILWSIFGFISFPLISLMPSIGSICWFAFTCCYAVGVASTATKSGDTPQ